MEELTSGKTVGVLACWRVDLVSSTAHYMFNPSVTSRSMIGYTARAC